jgi:hypothetical protein
MSTDELYKEFIDCLNVVTLGQIIARCEAADTVYGRIREALRQSDNEFTIELRRISKDELFVLPGLRVLSYKPPGSRIGGRARVKFERTEALDALERLDAIVKWVDTPNL